MMENGLFYQLISAISQSIAGIGMAISLEVLLTGREERGSRRKRFAFWYVLIGALTFAKCLTPVNSVNMTIVNPFLMSLEFIFMLAYYYSDKTWVKITHASMVIIQNVLPDFAAMAILGDIRDLDFCYRPFANPYRAERCVMNSVNSVLLNIIYITIVLNLRKKGRREVNPIWIAIVLPAVLMLFGFWSINKSQDRDKNVVQYMIMMCVWMILEFILVMVYLSYMEKQEAKEEADRLSHAMTLERFRYEQIEEQREKMAKLRHDYNNILTSVLFLLKNERLEEARTVIADLLKYVEETEEADSREEDS